MLLKLILIGTCIGAGIGLLIVILVNHIMIRKFRKIEYNFALLMNQVLRGAIVVWLFIIAFTLSKVTII